MEWSKCDKHAHDPEASPTGTRNPDPREESSGGISEITCEACYENFMEAGKKAGLQSDLQVGQSYRMVYDGEKFVIES